MMFEAELQEEIGKAIPCIIECLKDPNNDVCCAAANGLSSLGAYCMCHFVFALLVS
jgi:HEAT repeat protein